MTQDLYTLFCPINGALVMSFEAACKAQKEIVKSLMRQAYEKKCQDYAEMAKQCTVTYLKTITF